MYDNGEVCFSWIEKDAQLLYSPVVIQNVGQLVENGKVVDVGVVVAVRAGIRVGAEGRPLAKDWVVLVVVGILVHIVLVSRIIWGRNTINQYGTSSRFLRICLVNTT